MRGRLLIMTGVNKYLEFKLVDGSYVLKDNKINKVPATETEVETQNSQTLNPKP